MATADQGTQSWMQSNTPVSCLSNFQNICVCPVSAWLAVFPKGGCNTRPQPTRSGIPPRARPSKLGGLLWPFQPMECGRSDAMWLPRLSHKRDAASALLAGNWLLSLWWLNKLTDGPEATMLGGSSSYPTGRGHTEKPWRYLKREEFLASTRLR